MWFIDRIIRHLDRLSDRLGQLASWMLVCLVACVVIVVGLRYVLAIGFVWMQELYIWFHAAAFLLGAGYTLRHDGHVRIDLFYRRARPRIRALINCIGCVIFAAPFLWLTADSSWPVIVRSWRLLEGSREAGGLPGVFLFKTLILVFAIAFSVQFLALFLSNLKRLISLDESGQ